MTALLLVALFSVAGTAAHARPSRHSLGEIIEFLKRKTGHEFVYRKGILDEQEVVTADLEDASLEELLESVFRARGYDHEIVDNVIVLRKAAPRPVASLPQERARVRGVVRNADGVPLPGATVRIKGLPGGVAANAEGRFELSFVNDKEIVFVVSFVGMEERETRYTGQKEINVFLREKPEVAEEVIVVGYSTRKAGQVTGSVQRFHGEDLAGSTVSGNLMNALRGHTTGLQVTGNEGRPGSDGALLLRGLGTLYGVVDDRSPKNVYPLIVIDGVITDYTSLSGVIAPLDVADITVLKDAASTAIYGSRAATGVIVVTTKRGRQEEMTLSFNLNAGASVPRFGGLKLMDSAGLLEHGEATLRNWWKNNEQERNDYPEVAAFIERYTRYIRDHHDLTKTTNWRDLLNRTGRALDASFSLQGGSEKARYYFSYNYLDEQGTRIGYHLTRHLLRVRLDVDINPRLSLGTNLSGSFSRDISPTSGGLEYSYHPWISPYHADGTLKYSLPNKTDFNMNATDIANPLADGRYNDATCTSHRLFGSFHGTLKPLPWLSFTSTNTVTLSSTGNNIYADSRTYSGNNADNKYSNGTLSVDETRERSFLTSNILRLRFSAGDHQVDGLLGQEWYERWSRGWGVAMYDQNVPGERNVGGFSKMGDKTMGTALPAGSEVEAGSFSLFSEVHYNYLRRYVASLSFRRDASTNFGKKRRDGDFYSASASWVIIEEDFMRDREPFSNLKLRASYGTSGKEAGKDYLNYTLYSTGGELDNMYNYYALHPVHVASYIAAIEQRGNDRLSWETAHNLNIGIDIGLFDQRLQLSVDKYRRVNSDLIMEVTLPASNGVGRQYRNVGEMINSGVEVILTTRNVGGERFRWHSEFTFSYNKNRITRLDNGQLVRAGYPTLRVGENISALKKIKVRGIDPGSGKPLYERVEADGSVTLVNTLQEVITGNDDRCHVNIGLSRAPGWGGFSNTFLWGEWELTVNTSYSFNYKVLNSLKRSLAYGGAWKTQNVYRVPGAWKTWNKPGDRADLPAFNADPSLLRVEQDIDGESSLVYSKADHWRVSSIRLRYDVPGRWKARLRLRDASLSFLVDNVHAFTSREFAGYDPENPLGWVAPRRFILGLNLTF
jgi:TonB-linked SusC/RagA family outer membrane protein